MHPQREANPRSKHQMDAKERQRFREELSESAKMDQMKRTEMYSQGFQEKGSSRGSKGNILFMFMY